MTGKSSKNYIILAAITILYLDSVVVGLLQWVNINLLIGKRGESRKEDLLVELTSFTTSLILEEMTQYIPSIVADGLLIWRCYKVWNSSFKIISLSLFLFSVEIALYVAGTVISASPSPHATDALVNTINSAAMFTTLAATLWTTALIAYRIYSSSKHSLKGAKPHFYNILEIILQSSFAYSLALIADAVLVAIPQNQSNVWPIYIATNYAGVILSAITGIAPTLMVARVTLASNSTTDPTIIGVSGIQFGEQAPNIKTGEDGSHDTGLDGEARST
ncbi:hypothetical protein HYPSUDRAFT_44840 [Hypholoma sublateritium FD-334 SS-4]|uniref:Uncharacterized protein n=1 Tax=Hypholoma sublateritium (strain FD-334 SS-4) TaxID=945553 RepID=A0A0D2KVZ4_HYPSF|nr:hypothetical protein HYPSUDRAFT_44840 [Hypholoma sublateritium FD-334 SS-4]